MKLKNKYFFTLRENAKDEESTSGNLLVRSGMIKKVGAGIYMYLPLGLKTFDKIKKVVKEEMDNAGAQELLMPSLIPSEYYEACGRVEAFGKDMFNLKDRFEKSMVLGPTHEEVFTDLVKNEVKSYKNLPLNIYQIQTKYRDEMRPRFGLIRSREFIMKDAYSFDTSLKGLDVSYEKMKNTYIKIFDELHLNYKIVLADTGAIGGDGSHQFMALSDVGESTIIYCDYCNYAADEEKAESKMEVYNEDEELKVLEEVLTPDVKTIEEVSSYLNIKEKDLAKTLIYYAKDKYVAVLIRGDREVNDIKLCNALDIAEFELRLASDKEIEELHLEKGFLGPVGLDLEIYMDKEIETQKNLVIGANKHNYHMINANLNRDFKVTKIVDIRLTKQGDICPVCGKRLSSQKGIEVGQIFKLGTKYSASMGCTYLDESGVNKPMVMGCYGIGISRSLQSIIDQNHDEYGIKWPMNVAPYHVVVVPVNYKDEEMNKLADTIYTKLSNEEVILDDRDFKPGFKFKDWDLIGIPYMIIVGRRASEGYVEVKNRYTNEKIEMEYNEAIEFVSHKIKEAL